MAKPKLSPEEREALRQDLRKGLAVEKAAKKYHLSSNSIRWHLKKIRGPQASNGRKEPGKQSRREANVPRRLGRKRLKARAQRLRGTAGGRQGLIKLARVITPEQVQKLAAVQRLLPKHDELKRARAALARELSSVKKAERKLEHRLQRIDTRARKIETKIHRLTAR